MVKWKVQKVSQSPAAANPGHQKEEKNARKEPLRLKKEMHEKRMTDCLSPSKVCIVPNKTANHEIK